MEVVIAVRVTSLPRSITTYCKKTNTDDSSVSFLVSDASFELPWYLKIQWVLLNVSTVTAVVITLLFYSLLTPGQYGTTNGGYTP